MPKTNDRCVYCGRPVRQARSIVGKRQTYELTCAAHRDLIARDPKYTVLR